MAGQAGLNFPADMRLLPQFGAFLGARWLRVVLKPDVDLTPWINDAHARGMKVLGVIANESLHNGDVNMTSVEAARFYRTRYGALLDKLQVGNEWEHVSPSSWTMSPAVMNHFLQVFSVEFPDTPIVLGGCADGRPEALDDIDPDLYDEVGVNAYGQRPNDEEDWSETPGNFGNIQELLPRYVEHSGGKPIAVTEIGLSTSEVSEAFQARYIGVMVTTLLELPYCTMVIVFCADDAMVEAFGLYDADSPSNPKPAAAAFIRAAGPMPKPEPEEPPVAISDDQAMDEALKDLWEAGRRPVVTMEEYDPAGMAMCNYWKTHAGEMGSPAGKEHHASNGNAYCAFANGIWRWNSDGSNRIEQVA